MIRVVIKIEIVVMKYFVKSNDVILLENVWDSLRKYRYFDYSNWIYEG